jgi:hypothetical protein
MVHADSTTAQAAASAISSQPGDILPEFPKLPRSGRHASPSGGHHHYLEVISLSTATTLSPTSSFFSHGFSSSSRFSRRAIRDAYAADAAKHTSLSAGPVAAAKTFIPQSLVRLQSMPLAVCRRSFNLSA